MKKLFFLLTILFSFQAIQISAQNYKRSNNIPVIDQNGKRLLYPWAGGMNDAQFFNIDVNLDGTQDILVFDGQVGKFTPYIYDDTASNPIVFDPKFIANFEDCECQKWAQVVDYNCDDRADIICGSGSVGQHFKVYENTIFNGDSLGFVLKYDPLKEVNPMAANPNIPREIFIINSDIPGIIDIDFDGDLDIVSTQNGFDFWAYHQNLAMDRFGRCDTMVFQMATNCWGNFSESNLDNTLFVADTINCPPPPRGSGDLIDPRHVGSTMLILDLNGDSLYDALLGDISFPTVSGVINNGTIDWAFMDSSFTDFPSYDSAIDVELFPGLYYVDVDNDGKKDLIASSHEPVAGENKNGVVFYKNFGENNFPDFRFQGRGFIADEHIDVGSFSTPVFFDHNNDGLEDLLVGSRVLIMNTADSLIFSYQLQLFENTGSLTRPEFTLIDDDYMDGSTRFLEFEDAAMTFGDLDGDGDEDMIMGNTLGTLTYYKNEAAPGANADLQLQGQGILDANGLPIDIGTLSAPELFDYDDDGDLDLFAGDRFGKIAYYENIGNPTNFSFTKITGQWGGINIKFIATGYEFYGRTKPRFIDYDNDDTTELILATEDGYIEVYEDLTGALTDTLSPSSILFDGDFGDEASIDAAILDTSGNYTFVIGSERGGLHMFNTVEISDQKDTTSVGFPDLTEDIPFRLAPNPASDRVRIIFDSDEILFAEKQISLINQMGQEVFRESSQSKRLDIDLTSLAGGIYYVRIRSEGQQWLSKLIHRK